MLSDNLILNLKTVIVDRLLFNSRILVAERNHYYLQWNLEVNLLNTITWTLQREPFSFHLVKTSLKENVFNNAPISRIAVAMITNSVVAGSFQENSSNYQQFILRELRIIRDGRFLSYFYGISLKSLFFLVFDLTLLEDAAEQNLVEKA